MSLGGGIGPSKFKTDSENIYMYIAISVNTNLHEIRRVST